MIKIRKFACTSDFTTLCYHVWKLEAQHLSFLFGILQPTELNTVFNIITTTGCLSSDMGVHNMSVNIREKFNTGNGVKGMLFLTKG